MPELTERPPHSRFHAQGPWRQSFLRSVLPSDVEPDGREKIMVQCPGVESFGFRHAHKSEQPGSVALGVEEAERDSVQAQKCFAKRHNIVFGQWRSSEKKPPVGMAGGDRCIERPIGLFSDFGELELGHQTYRGNVREEPGACSITKRASPDHHVLNHRAERDKAENLAVEGQRRVGLSRKDAKTAQRASDLEIVAVVGRWGPYASLYDARKVIG